MRTGNGVYYTVEGSGPALVMLHGFFMSTAMYDTMAHHYAESHTVIRIDSRGHGQTDHGRTPYTLWDQVDDVIDVLDDTNVTTATLIGHSQGGFIAQRLALSYPDRVSSLILLASESGPSPAEEQAGYRELFAAWDSQGPTAELTTPLATQIIGDERIAEQWSAYWQARTGIPVVPAGDCLIGRDDITDRLPEITCPALTIRGSEDQAISAERAQPLIEHLPRLIAAITIPGAAHTPHLTHPAVVHAAIDQFLALAVLPA